jgi:hypothetical protein
MLMAITTTRGCLRIDSQPPTIAKSIAYSKVDTAGAIKPAWATAKDAKYFYENDNILWCDPTHPLWPHQGPVVTQTCIGGSTAPQNCQNRVDQSFARIEVTADTHEALDELILRLRQHGAKSPKGRREATGLVSTAYPCRNPWWSDANL